MPLLPFIFLVAFSVSSAAQAQKVDECRPALILSTYTLTSSDRFDYRLAEHVSEETYNQIKRGAGGSANVLIYGVPAGGSYKDFRDQITSIKRSTSTSTSLTRDQAVNLMWTGLDRASAGAYQACLDALSRQTGLLLATIRATETAISVRVSFRAAAGQRQRYSINWSKNARTSDGSALPRAVEHAADVIVLLKRPTSTEQIAVNSRIGGDYIVLEPLPAAGPSQVCTKQGDYHFSDSSCGDGYSLQGGKIVVRFGSGGSTVVPLNIPDYRADIGVWFAGDFNGDGRTDLVHIARKFGSFNPRIHAHFGASGNTFLHPTTFIFTEFIKDYDANLGDWAIGYDAKMQRATLEHAPKLPDHRLHVWRAKSDGSFALGGR